MNWSADGENVRNHPERTEALLWLGASSTRVPLAEDLRPYVVKGLRPDSRTYMLVVSDRALSVSAKVRDEG
jgi:hypothetical protein